MPIDDRHDHVRAEDIRRADDLDQLRRIALAQQVQIKHLLDVLKTQSEQLDALRGSSGDLQEKLALLNALAEQSPRRRSR